MKVLFDTNIVLDLLLDRKPYTVKAQQLFAMVETNVINGVLGATTITTIDYLVTRAMDRHHAQTAIIRLLKLFEIAPVNRVILENALVIKFHDYEDAVLHEAGIEMGVQAIVTRDANGFKHAAISVYEPEELLRMLGAAPKN